MIDGKEAAKMISHRVRAEVSRLIAEHELQPGLAVVLVGDDPASQVYVRNKGRQTREAGLLSQEYKLGGSVSEEELLELIRQLNESAAIHGILVQLPLPEHICEQRIGSAAI